MLAFFWKPSAFTNGRTAVFLIPMVHIADRSFYDGVLRDCFKAQALILEEAVIPTEAIGSGLPCSPFFLLYF